MNTLYAKNGLVFWTEKEIKLRRLLEDYFVSSLTNALKIANRGFEFAQVEAPILTPKEFIATQYTDEDVFVTNDLVMRPETTMGSYEAAKELLDPYRDRKYKLPLVVWQHGKSFRKEQDSPFKHMKLKEFYQLEFQILFSPQTKNDYSYVVIKCVEQMIQDMIGSCRTEASDRLPSYSSSTTDVICTNTNMEVCSISRRKDFPLGENIEVAIGTDRCVYNMLNK